MKALLPLSLLTILLARSALADCPPPDNAVIVPDGASATKEAMVAAQHAVKDYNAAVQQFTECLKAEQDAKIAAGGDKLKDTDKQKIAGEYVARQNAEIDKLQKIADKFNVELRAWKAKNAPPAPAQ